MPKKKLRQESETTEADVMEIKRLYVEEYQSLRKISAKLEISDVFVRKVLRESSLTRKPTSEKRILTPEQVPETTRQKLKDVYLNEKGMTVARAALLCQLTRPTASKVLNEMGVVRTRSEMKTKAQKEEKAAKARKWTL